MNATPPWPFLCGRGDRARASPPVSALLGIGIGDEVSVGVVGAGGDGTWACGRRIGDNGVRRIWCSRTSSSGNSDAFIRSFDDCCHRRGWHAGVLESDDLIGRGIGASTGLGQGVQRAWGPARRERLGHAFTIDVSSQTTYF